VWKKNEEYKFKCGIYICMFYHDYQWYIDSGCYHHMLGEKSGFLSLRKTKDGHVILGDNTHAKVLGKGKVILGNEELNAVDVLLVEGLKQNILSVIQMVYGGKEVIFNSKVCCIRKEKSKRVISKEIRTSYNVYVLKERVAKIKRSRTISSSSYYE